MLPHVRQVRAILESVTQITRIGRVFLLVDSYQSFTRQIRAYQHEKVGEKVGENRGKFYLSPTVCQ